MARESPSHQLTKGEDSPPERIAARSSTPSVRVSVPDHVVRRPFPTETVVLNLETGRYHGLNPVAGRMLEELETQGAIEAAALVVAEEFGQPVEQVTRDMAELCRDLSKRGLISMEPG